MHIIGLGSAYNTTQLKTLLMGIHTGFAAGGKRLSYYLPYYLFKYPVTISWPVLHTCTEMTAASSSHTYHIMHKTTLCITEPHFPKAYSQKQAGDGK